MTATRLESKSVSNILDDGGDVDWKVVIDLLRDGKVVEIPCERERDYVRRSTQVVKRAENRGITVEVVRGDGHLRVEPRPGAVSGDVAGDPTAPAESREALQLERHQQREARRAEREAERNRES
jgi:uncharacterized protein YuzE